MGQYCKGWGAMRSSQEEIKKYSKDFLYLLCCAVNDLTPEQSRVRPMNPEIMMNLADLHGVSAMTSYALYKSGLGGDFRAQWKQTMDQSQRKAALYEIERQSIRQYCEQERIRYMFLKGHLMQQYYPVYGMREMSDIDILAEQNARPLLQAFLFDCGYSMEEIGESNHDAYHREPFFNVEVHVGLFRPELEPVFTEYYRDIFDRLIPGEGTEQHFSKEDFYIYHILHAVKHLHYGGIGVKALTDTCLLLRKETGLDWTYIAEETKKISVEDDEKLLRKTAQKVFSPLAVSEGYQLTAEEEGCLLYILESGAYGTMDHYVSDRLSEHKENGKATGRSKLRYLKDRLYPLQDTYREMYPFFYHHKWAFPFLPFYRLLRAVRGGRDSILEEIKALKNS